LEKDPKTPLKIEVKRACFVWKNGAGSLTILYYSATCVLCGPALATAAVAAAETGQVLNGFAILPIPDGGQLGDYCNLANASACSALCNATTRCSGWSYTKAGRKACPLGCCFLKAGDQATLEKYMRPCPDFHTGTVDFGPPVAPPAGTASCNLTLTS
jgi:hypothetical protein